MSNEDAKMKQMETLLKKSLLTIRKLESEVERLKDVQEDEIAVVSMAYRLPGGVRTIEDLWDLLVSGKDTIKEIPADRWDLEKTYDPDPLAPGKTNTKYGAFLEEDIRAFDAEFFGISPREAKSIDPTQRMLLEVSHEALEMAGIAPDSLKTSNTGVFLGIGNSDYAQARLRSGDLEDVDGYDMTGVPLATAAGRISYQFDLQGPSYTVDAACSSSLVSIHLAADALRNQTCEIALVGSANLLLTPEYFIGLTKLGSLSPDGKCRAFDEHGNGYVRGEGCGVTILTSRRYAEAHNLPVLSIIKGSSIVHDGLSNGYTAPNPDTQVKMGREALAKAQLKPSDIDFVESHGVGNKFTDAMEIQALYEVYGKRNHPLYVGSIKPNLGHMEAAIGLAMLGKVIGAIRHEQIPPNINFETPNTDVNWSAIPVEIPVEVKSWETEDRRRAAINLTSYNGTNTHLIVEEYRAEEPGPATDNWQAWPFQLSAASEASLHALVDQYLDEEAGWLDQPLKDIAYTLARGRSSMAWKLSVPASDVDTIREALKVYRTEGKHKLVKTSDPSVKRKKQVAFLFTGQGAQYHDMCKDLYDEFEVFRTTVDACAIILKPYLEHDLLDVLFGESPELINQTAYTQPGLFVVEYALYMLWGEFGVQPSAVVGHSVGEYVALTVAGVLSLEDALRLIAARGRLIQSLPTGIGGMAAVLGEEAVVLPYLEGNPEIDVAAVNSPKSLTISGKKEAIETVIERMKEDRVKAIGLTVSHAFHSYQMDPILKEFEQEVAKVTINHPQIPLISNATGKEITRAELTPEYFSRHIRGTVRFKEDIQYLDNELGIDVFLEAGPNPTLIGLAKQGIDKPQAAFISSGKKKQASTKHLMEGLIELFHSGIPVRWDKVFSSSGARIVQLPVNPWQREVFWVDPVHGLGETAKPKVAQESASPVMSSITKDNLLPLMQATAAQVLGLPPGKELDIYKSMREQGFDSMMSGEFLARMEKYLGVPLEMSLIHVYSDMNSLYNYFVKEILGDEEGITMSDVMFDTGLLADQADSGEDWHTIKEDDGALMKWFKKLDKKLGVGES